MAMMDMRLRSEVNGISPTRVYRLILRSALTLRAATISETSVGSPTISQRPFSSRSSPSFASVPATSVATTSSATIWACSDSGLTPPVITMRPSGA